MRELSEELNLNPDQYSLVKTDIINEFVYGNHPTRAGQRIKKQVYLIKVNDNAEIVPNLEEVRDALWMDEEEALRLIWPGCREIFKKVIALI